MSTRPPTRIGLIVLLLAWLPLAPAIAEDEVDRLVETLEEHAREPFEQKKREAAIRKLGGIGGKKAARALLPVFEDPFEHLEDHAVSAWIAMLKGKNAGDTQTWLSERPIKAKRANVRIGAWTALGLTGGSELEEVFLLGIRSEKDGDVLAAIADASMRLRDGADLKDVLSSRFNHKSGRAAFALAQAAVRYEGETCVPRLVKLLKHREPVGRAGAVLALQELGRLESKHVSTVLKDKASAGRIALAESLWRRTEHLPWPGAAEDVWKALLADADWRVRAAAVQGALRIWDRRIVVPLIERLDAESGRVKEDIQRALETFTDHTVAMDADLWRSWWSARSEDFEPGEQPRADRAGRIPFRDASSRPDAEDGGTAAFFDVPLYSKRIVFVFDLSGSFRDPAFDGPDAPTKLELLQKELDATLAALPRDTLFDLLVYRYPSKYPPKPRLERAFGKLTPADPRAVKKAKAWLAKQPAKGWGAFMEPLEALMAEDVDTAVLLSDGRPSRGRLDRDWRILQVLPGLNRFSYLAINTILIGDKEADREFMERLAAATGGRFRAAEPGK
ncbi:MAG: hypothetical protein QNJ98_17135 [Planctomycetota bacterium]|nr:hypothetical protein [Planctomycetota bacterium]